ncbi:hypothetical protein FRB99_008887, partial [Tulasnella sp. 403]
MADVEKGPTVSDTPAVTPYTQTPARRSNASLTQKYESEKKVTDVTDTSSLHSGEEKGGIRAGARHQRDEEPQEENNGPTFYQRFRPFILAALALLILGWWISATILEETRHRWPTVIIGLMFQQIVAMFVLKTRAGFDIFSWIATLAADFLEQAYAGAAFFFSQDIVNKHWFFVNTLSAIIFFIAFIQMMYYLGVMQWLIKKFAWFFFKTMNVSGAEAVVAAASPWVGQGESACLVKPYVDLMTDSEIHLTMTSGFSTIAGSVLSAYIALGVPPQNLVTASVMSIPASISISKLRCPETDEPVTRGNVVVHRGTEEKNAPVNALQAFGQGALFGLVVAGQILASVLTIIGLVAATDGLLTWIGRGFAIHNLTLQLIFGYILYPV